MFTILTKNFKYDKQKNIGLHSRKLIDSDQ